MLPGSTVANLTALWAAREAGCTEVVSSTRSHLSIRKSAHLLGLRHRAVEHWHDPGTLDRSAVVLTAGQTSTGEIEPLDAAPAARWRHVDAAWAGPLRFSDRHGHRLDGIEDADSVAVSAHKWLFQPKESALVLFADSASAHASISLDATYLAVPNVGLLGSHGAVAAPLLATLLAYGRRGIAAVIDHSMALADQLFALVDAHDALVARSAPQSGVVLWRHANRPTAAVVAALPADVVLSTTTLDRLAWLRSVAANPMADPASIVDAVVAAGASA
ncbi:MAG: pyridoxal-dependent decarboxylase [Acidimicrobiales bacterium]